MKISITETAENRSPKKGKFSLPRMGLWAIGVALGLLLLSLITPFFTRIAEPATITKQVSDVRNLMLACKSYSLDHDGSFPPSLGDLYRLGYLDGSGHVETDLTMSGEKKTYLYRPGLVEKSLSPMIMAPEPYKGRRIVGYTNGRVIAEREPEFSNQLDWRNWKL